MRRLLFFLLFSLSFLSAAARHIVGRVVDGKTHEDLAGAVVELLNPRDSSVIKSRPRQNGRSSVGRSLSIR